MAKSCSKCGKKLSFFSVSEIRGIEYCSDCALKIPVCKKCRYYTTYVESPYVGGCTYHEWLLNDEYDVCDDFIAKFPR